MATPDALPRLLTIEQLVEQFGTSTRHIRRVIAERRIPYLKVGNLVRFDPEEINHWLDENRIAMRPPAVGPRSRLHRVE